VQWHVEDLTLEYAAQIEGHFSRILSSIQMNHWRTNPNVLTGMKIAIFRKGPAPIPSILTGFVDELFYD
jgi:hypothetical protein